MKPVRFRTTAWIAILAILLAALSPSAVLAVSSPQKVVPWNEICSVAGTQAASADQPASGSGQHRDGGSKHCPWCLNHTSHAALPSVPMVSLPLAGGSADDFSDFVTAPSSHFIRIAAQPRAPPANS